MTVAAAVDTVDLSWRILQDCEDKPMSSRGRSRVRAGDKCHSRRDEALSHREQRQPTFTVRKLPNGDKVPVKVHTHRSRRGGRIGLLALATIQDLAEGVHEHFAPETDDDYLRRDRVVFEDPDLQENQLQRRRDQTERRGELNRELNRLRVAIRSPMIIDRRTRIHDKIARLERELYGIGALDHEHTAI